MSSSEEMKKSAIDKATELLSTRLKQGGISTSRPDFYFQCEAEEPRAYAGGFEVRVHTWRHWSDALVEFDADSGQLMKCSIRSYADPPNDQEMVQEEALEVANRAIEIPAEAVFRAFYHFNFTPNCKLARLEWERFYKGLRVVGDYLWVSIHPATHRIVEYARKWRTLRLGQ